VFYAFIQDDNVQSGDALRRVFNNIPKRTASRGLREIQQFLPKTIAIPIYLTAEHLIREYISTFESTQEQVDSILSMYQEDR
jgi:hypothetical protein